MALPQKTIDELSREPLRTPGWSGRLLMFSVTLLIVSLFVYGGLVFGYTPYLESQVKELKDQMQAFSQQVSLEDQEKITVFYSQLTHVKEILANRTEATPLFEWLEKRTNSNVFYTKFSYNGGSKQLVLGGSARSVADATEQIRIFQEDPVVERMNVGTLTFGNGNLWQFDLTLFFKESPQKEDVALPRNVTSTQP